MAIYDSLYFNQKIDKILRISDNFGFHKTDNSLSNLDNF